MPSTERPTIGSRTAAANDGPFNTDSVGQLIVTTLVNAMQKRGEMTGSEARRMDQHAQVHNLLWSFDGDRDVTPLMLAAFKLGEAAVNLLAAQPGQEALVVSDEVSRLAILAATFTTTAPKQPETQPETRTTSPLAANILGRSPPTPPMGSESGAAA
jgi:hypothetical protein